jgi:hypothetical protein
LEKLITYNKDTGEITLKKSDKYKKGSYEICISINAAGNMEYWDGYDDVYFTLTIK